MLFSPIDSKNRRLDEKEKHHYRKIVHRFVVLFLVIILVLLEVGADEYAVCVAVGVVLPAGLQLPCIVKWLKTNQNRP